MLRNPIQETKLYCDNPTKLLFTLPASAPSPAHGRPPGRVSTRPRFAARGLACPSSTPSAGTAAATVRNRNRRPFGRSETGAILVKGAWPRPGQHAGQPWTPGLPANGGEGADPPGGGGQLMPILQPKRRPIVGQRAASAGGALPAHRKAGHHVFGTGGLASPTGFGRAAGDRHGASPSSLTKDHSGWAARANPGFPAGRHPSLVRG